MRYRKLGKNGPEVSEVGFGAWAIGGGMWGGRRDDDARAALDRAFERGVNFVDTALVYGDGHSERLVGEFAARARRRGLRRDQGAAQVVPVAGAARRRARATSSRPPGSSSAPRRA